MSAKRRGPEGAPPGDRLWGGGFRQPLDPDLDRFCASFAFDRRLLDPEVRANRAWVEALAGAGLLSASDAAAIDAALRTIGAETIPPGGGGAQQARTGERLHPGAVGADLRIERLAETASPEPIAGRGTLGAPPFRAHRPASRGRVLIGSAAERGASRAVSSIPAPSTPAPRVDRPNRRMNPAASRGSYSSPITK